MKITDTITITVPEGTKARWMQQSQAQGIKLSEWVCKRVEHTPDVDGYLSQFSPKKAGSVVILSEAQLRDVMRKAYLAGAMGTKE